jgi:hypothetical protein
MKTIKPDKTLIIGLIFIILSSHLTLLSQTWTEPINISNMPGLDNQPDLCIDKNGILHCVFVHKLASNWRKIYYTKSTDDGETWTTPEDISLNPDTSLMNPHIIADTNGNLYVSYDYNTMNPAATLIKLKTFDGNQWSEPYVVSEGMYNSDHNKLCIDHNNRIYVFWGYLNHWTNYRYYENGQWSETFSPYYENESMETISVVVDSENNIHCIGWGESSGGPYAIYFSYLNDIDWTDWTIISPVTNFGSVGGGDISVNNENLPSIAYRQKSYGTGADNDSTMYTFFNGNNWSIPELVVNDPYEQKIVIDPYNRVHIIDREKIENGYKLVHYQKINEIWQGYIIDEAIIVVGNPEFIEINNILYLVYYECYSNDDCRIKFAKNCLTTQVKTEQNSWHNIRIFPNPFKTETTIEFELSNQIQVNISVYNLNGQKIKTLMNEKIKPGTYRLIWNGKDLNGKEVEAGLYLVRLQSGRNIVTQPVEVIK